MKKIDSIIDFSIILNAGYGSNQDCDFFDNVNHPVLIDLFIDYINKHKDYIQLTRIENRQSIADSGCDVFIELKGDTKIGVQIKSKGDVEDKLFSNKVKAQYAESSALGLDKFYILICSPITTSSEKKINYIVSHMATYKTNYHAVLNPNNCINFFQPGNQIDDSEFVRLKQLYSREDSKSNLESVLMSIQESLKSDNYKETDFHSAIKKAISREPFQAINSANKFIEFLDLLDNVDENEVISSINDFIKKLSKLSSELKRFFYLIISEASDSENYIDALEMNLYELESLLSSNPSELLGKIKILTSVKYNFLSYDEDEPDKVYANVWIEGDYNLINYLKMFCSENDISLESLIINGEFSLLD